jgi:hypothetical protein
MIRSTLLIFVLALAFNFVPKDGFGQCDVSLKLESVNHSTEGKNNGSISFKVQSQNSYECILSIISGAGIEDVQKFNDLGSKELKFENLVPGKFYQVMVIFNNENDFLCQRRVLTDIIIEEVK